MNRRTFLICYSVALLLARENLQHVSVYYEHVCVCGENCMKTAWTHFTHRPRKIYTQKKFPSVYSFVIGYILIAIYRVSQEECARLRESVPYVKVYRYDPKHLCPKLNGYGDNGQRKVWSSCGSTHCTCQLTILSISVLECGVI